MNRAKIDEIKQVLIIILTGKEFTYAEIICALGELISELAQRSVVEDKE